MQTDEVVTPEEEAASAALTKFCEAYGFHRVNDAADLAIALADNSRELIRLLRASAAARSKAAR